MMQTSAMDCCRYKIGEIEFKKSSLRGEVEHRSSVL